MRLISMIPLQLTLKNFLSYREATLDFRGLHVACICGANGAGKSSLLEAIAWAVWGQSRVMAEDDVIHLGETETQVDFLFQCHQQTYRIIRSRYRQQTSSLEFQVQTPNGFRSLTERNMRSTQQLILQHLKLDYETFINSAYLRQGRADEFMLKRPGERKQILADLLKLKQYDDLAEQAKERSRQLKAEVSLLERNLETITTQLEQRQALATEQETLAATLANWQHEQEQDTETLRQLQATQQQRLTWQQQLNLHQQQQQHLTQDCQRLQQEIAATQQQYRQIEAILQQSEAIATGYTQFQQLQAEEDVQSRKFQAHQTAVHQHQQLQQQQTEAINTLKDQLRQAQAQLEALHQQRDEIAATLAKAPDIEVALEQLKQARSHLAELDQLQLKVAPLLQRRQQVQSTLDRHQARLTARLEELQATTRLLEAQQQRQPQIKRAVLEVTELVEHLEQRRLYQQRVREKGLERRNFMERLQAHQRDHELKLAELDHKIAMLKQGHGDEEHDAAGHGEDRVFHASNGHEVIQAGHVAQLSSALVSASEYPPCPLCDRPLDEHHWTLVLEKHQTEQQEVRDQLWVIREQLVVSEREIQVLRQEYRDLERELSAYGSILERRGQLQEQLQGASDEQTRLQQIAAEQAELERSLHSGNYAPELQEELRLLDQTLQHLNYDDKNHAIARGEVDRWRWAEIKQAEIKQAQRRATQIAARQPELEAIMADLEQHLDTIHHHSPLQQQIQHLEQQIAEIGYDLQRHTAIRATLRQAQAWQLRQQELTQAQQHYPQLQRRLHELSEVFAARTQALHTVIAQVEELSHHLQQVSDRTSAIHQLEQQMLQRRTQLDEQLGRLGRLQQQQQQLDLLQQQVETQQQQLQTLRRQSRIHQELAQAFGKNGIQALMIENVLPQLETEANRILGQLSNHQLHVQFVTQRAGRRRSAAQATKLIDTLDILIADAQGTRPYETYSGGEAFRVNFAIRLALARLLAQRSGTALQMLIVDEGFGTQDAEGCDRLISAINAIASDFACILTVTHMPHFKEAFQARIEVCKTHSGSQLQFSI
ncbi:MAG: SMC family ATPase [Oculatellaceae cyanobacterium bins.114]|nr:SMC family ATPase [Oculatellaceae cyanobacterium bins.114]